MRFTQLLTVCLALAVVAAAGGVLLLSGRLSQATHTPPVATFSVDVDPSGSISSTTPESYVADPDGDSDSEDNSLHAGAINSCIQVPAPVGTPVPITINITHNDKNPNWKVKYANLRWSIV